jgi:hypothetical protein
MRQDIFSLPVFIDQVDLTKIDIGEHEPDKIWLSETPSTLGKHNDIPVETLEYLAEVIGRNLQEHNLLGPNPKFGQIWRNYYEENDWQDIHIHPHSAWSFIIYEDVIESKTVFMNPVYKDIQNHLGTNVEGFPLDFRPELKTGDILIFPSFLEHFVRSGNAGTTISGNVYMDYS